MTLKNPTFFYFYEHFKSVFEIFIKSSFNEIIEMRNFDDESHYYN